MGMFVVCSRFPLPGRVLLLLLLLVLPQNAFAQVTRQGETFEASKNGQQHRYPDAAYDPNHQLYFAVSGRFIKGRFVTLDGTPVGTASFQIPQTSVLTMVPRVAFGGAVDGGNGGFLVTWLDSRLNPNSSVVFGRVVGVNGDNTPKFLTGDFQIGNTTGAFSESGPAIAYAGGGQNRFLVAWRNSPNAEIKARLVAADGTLIGNQIDLTSTTDNAEIQSLPSVAYNGAGEFFVVYTTYKDATNVAGVKGQRINASTGALIGTPVTLDSAGATYVTEVIFDGTQYFAAWARTLPSGGRVFYGRFLGSDGSLNGSILALATQAAYDALGLARNPMSDTYFLVTHGSTVENVGFQISSTGGTEPKVTVTHTTVESSGNFNPRIAATGARQEWLVATDRSFNTLVAQRIKTDGFVGGPPPPPPPPPNCTYSVSPTSISAPAGGGFFGVNVSTTAGCAWTATSNKTFVTFSAGTAGNGGGMATADVSPNTGTTVRTATLTIAGKSVSVSQSASSGSGGGGAGTPAPLPANQWDTVITTVGDFNGDGASDPTVFRSTTANWFIQGQSSISWGSNIPADLDQPVPADYDGDGITDAAVFRRTTSTYSIRQSSNGQSITRTLGSAALFDVPVPADYDGDGKGDIAVYRRTTGEWFVLQSSNNYNVQKTYKVGVDTGTKAFVPVPGDYNGDGKADPAVYLTTTGQWSVLGGSTNKLVGAANVDMPVPADYDGDGKTDMAVFNLNTAIWKIDYSGPSATFNQNFGATALGDVPVPGDYDGDGKADVAVFRSSIGYWFIKNSSGGNSAFQWPASPNTADIVHLP